MEDFAKHFSKCSTEKIKPSLGWYCKDHEKDLAIRKNLGQCTYLGSYCQNKSLLGVCIVKMHVSCCFNSPVTKLIRDNFAKQGMFQLGTAKHPSCGGIALTDLMKMNMENFDSSEVEARMAAGGFSPDIGELASLTGEEFDVRMFGSGNSLNDPTRKSLTERTTERLDGVDETLGEGYEAITNDVNSRSNTTNTDVEDPDSPGAITFNPGLYFVDEGKIAWDDPVIKHMPWFRMYDAWVTREITIRDLLVHRSGLGLGQGDLMFVPRTHLTRKQTVERVAWLKPQTSFRSAYAYDNILYAVAGQLIEEVTGQRWEDFIRARILRAGKAPGILMRDEALVKRHLELGALFVAVDTDSGLLARSTSAIALQYKGQRAAAGGDCGSVY